MATFDALVDNAKEAYDELNWRDIGHPSIWVRYGWRRWKVSSQTYP
jgi:hypothetical protein